MPSRHYSNDTEEIKISGLHEGLTRLNSDVFHSDILKIVQLPSAYFVEYIY